MRLESHCSKFNHRFAEQLLQFCLTKILNKDGNVLITTKVSTHSFVGFKLYVKNRVINSYNEICNIDNCESCRRTQQ